MEYLVLITGATGNVGRDIINPPVIRIHYLT
jgi:hypothetical protein